MKIVKEEKKNWRLFTNNQKSCGFLKKILEKLFKTSNKKFVIKSKCKDSCCCRNCNCIVGYDEKSDDDSEEDIVISGNNVIIK